MLPHIPADALLMLLLAAGAGAAVPFILWRRALARIRELEFRLLPQVQDDARLELLQSTMDQLARQSEQLAESQDFLGRIIADRLSSPPPQVADEEAPSPNRPPLPPPRETTPH